MSLNIRFVSVLFCSIRADSMPMAIAISNRFIIVF